MPDTASAASGGRPAGRSLPDTESFAAAIRAGDRRMLARAITLVESTRTDHRAAAEALLEALLPDAGRALRVGISGTPGVGKSTFIEALGLHLVDSGKRLAVLAVDPTSARSGGSILGDKTRMEQLSRRPEAFIRPSPAGRSLGGVARRTREALLLCDAAGHDVVLVETVGIGQSETAVADMVDLFMLLLAPGGGDDLQGIKRGVMELADLIVINKADGDLLPAAKTAQADYRSALGLMRPRFAAWKAEVLLASALRSEGIGPVWERIEAFRQGLTDSGEFDRQRADQAVSWMWRDLTDTVVESLQADAELRAAAERREREVRDGRSTPMAAARSLLEAFLRRGPEAARP
ncbi:methylmalonyl Co-A mutase-associated GTPase MeaB [Marinibaculum pumilum]|uniref:Methylmalonyl Co-A mutase-associated GTPase MeaB n=1 Tax=Marinibaculum pumilum TaxID=1766165 RepID=A0ABV7KXX8_9PROT